MPSLTCRLAAICALFAALSAPVFAQPYMGWSSWSLQATTYPGYGGGDNWPRWLTAEHVKAQADVMHAKLQSHGYNYVNMDSGWRAENFDDHGLPLAEPTRFPAGIADMAQYVHRRGLKLGIYYNPGIPDNLYKANPTIEGTSIHIQDIVVQPLQHATGWNSNYRIDFSRPGAQAYIDSLAHRFAGWGVDFLKLDGVTPGSDRPGQTGLETDGRAEVAAWGHALRRTGRPIWLELSWDLDGTYMDDWSPYANGWRVYTDVETYGPTLTAWYAITRRFARLRNPVMHQGGWGWCDLDSIEVGCGAMDGLTLDERQSVVTLWAINHAPLYTGDDLTKLDADGLRLLTNDEVIAADHTVGPTVRIDRGNVRLWYSVAPNGTRTVAVFNLDDKNPATVALKWSDLGIDGIPRVRDLWAHANLGIAPDGIPLSDIPPHGSRLLTLTPETPTPAIPYHITSGDDSDALLSIRNGSLNDAAPLTVTRTADDSALWQILPTGDGTSVLLNEKSGELVNIPGPTNDPGASLVQYFDDGKPNSRWRVMPLSDGQVRFVSVSNGMALERTDSGAVVQMPVNETSRHQRWRLVKTTH